VNGVALFFRTENGDLLNPADAFKLGVQGLGGMYENRTAATKAGIEAGTKVIGKNAAESIMEFDFGKVLNYIILGILVILVFRG
jgi:hypothetical protein